MILSHDFFQASAHGHTLRGGGRHTHIETLGIGELSVGVDAEQFIYTADEIARIHGAVLHLFPFRIR